MDKSQISLCESCIKLNRCSGYIKNEETVIECNLYIPKVSTHDMVESDNTAVKVDSSVGNQELKRDAGKLQLTLVPTQIITDIARVREFGVAKYHKRDSWKQVEIQRYRDALFRHLLLYLNDPKGVDDESGLPHLSHVACNVAFLCELEKEDGNGSTDK